MKDLYGKGIGLGDFVSYQEGSIVSREIIKKDVGTITVFSFDVGQGLSEHTAPYDALVQIIEGVGEVTIEGKPQDVKAGEFIIMPANKPHSLLAKERFKMMLVMIRSD